MIDIHSHILPGIDDGAKNLSMALDMLRMAVDTGVTTQVLTPHIQPGKFDNNKSTLEKKFNSFKTIVDSKNIGIDLKLGSEVRIGPEVIPLLQQDEIPLLGEHMGKKTFLLEFPPYEVPLGSDNLIRLLIGKGYLPIIVHPERNRTFTENPQKLKLILELGCPVQITASSLSGKFGEDALNFSLELLASEAMSMIATDCHNLSTRPPDLNRGLASLKNNFSAEKAASILSTSGLLAQIN